MNDSRKKFLALKNLALLKREVILFSDVQCYYSRIKKNILKLIPIRTKPES